MKLAIIRNISLITLLALITLIYFNCSDNNPIGTNTSSSLTLSGKITGWTLGIKRLRAMINSSRSGSQYEICTCPIDSSGNFSLTFPETIVDTTLFKGDSIFTLGCVGNVHINSAFAKGSTISGLDVMDSSNALGYVSFCNYDTLTTGTCYETYYYVNSDLTVNGTQFCYYSDTITYNCSFKRGWNKTYVHIINDYGYYHYTMAYNNTVCSGGEWKFKTFFNNNTHR